MNYDINYDGMGQPIKLRMYRFSSVYEGKTKIGDYFFIVPTVYATIATIPEELRKYIVVSDSLDFTKDRLLDNNKISDYFTHMYSE